MSIAIEGLPEYIRIKIWRCKEGVFLERDVLLEETLLEMGLNIEEKLKEADVKYEEHLKKIHELYGVDMTEEYVWTFPEPAILTISIQDIEKIPKTYLDKFLKESVIIKYRENFYKIVLEYPCG